MARTYKSDVMTGKLPKVFRGLKQGQAFEVTGVIKFPVGTVLGVADVLKFMRVGENVSVQRILLSLDADLDPTGTALAGEIGYTQALNTSDTALVVDAKTGTTYTSPTSDPNYFVTDGQPVGLTSAGVSQWVSGQTGLDNDFANYDADGFAGPVDLAITITAVGTASAAVAHMRFSATCVYKEAAQGEFSGDLATAYEDRYDGGSSSNGLIS